MNSIITPHKLNSLILENTLKADLVAVMSFDVNACLLLHGRIRTEVIAVHRSQTARRSRKPLLMMKNGDCPLTLLGLTAEEIYSLAVDSLSANSLTLINTEKGCALLSLGQLLLNGFAVLIIPEKRFQTLLVGGLSGRVIPFFNKFKDINRELDTFLDVVSIALSVATTEFELVDADGLRCTARALEELLDSKIRLAFADEPEHCYGISLKLFSTLLILASVTSREKGGTGIPDVEIVRYEDMFIARCHFRRAIRAGDSDAAAFDSSAGMNAFRRLASDTRIMLRGSFKRVTSGVAEITLNTTLNLAYNMPTGVKSNGYWDICRAKALLEAMTKEN